MFAVKLLQKSTPTYLLLLFFTISAYAQDRCEYTPPLQTKHWILGYGLGLNFEFYPDRTINEFSGSALTNLFFGRAVISSNDGDLLFYSDGINIYSSNHQIMENGENISNDVYNTILIVPQPGNDTHYYMFYIVRRSSTPVTYDLYYSVIDMSLNGGNGRVTIRNQLLYEEVSEKLTAVHHANSTDIWLVTHGFGDNNNVNSRFFSFLISNSGVDNSPVPSNTGQAHQGLNNEFGYLKISPRGDLIACAKNGDGVVQLFGFNNGNGSVGSAIRTLDGHERAYGIEFSSDSKFLYFTTSPWFSADEPQRSWLYQYDIDNDDLLALNNIGRPDDGNMVFGALQIGLDSKIYVTICDRRQDQLTSGSIGIIQNPKRQGTDCNFLLNGFDFSSLGVQKTLPMFIQSYFDIPHFTYYRHCEGDDVEFRLWNTSNTTTTTWDFGDGSPVTVTGVSHIRLFEETGNFPEVTVTENGTFGPYTEDIFIRPLPLLIPELLPDENVLLIFPNTIYPLDGGEGFYEYYWYYSSSPDGPWQLLAGGIGEAYRVRPIEDEGFYKLEVVDMECCENERIIEVRALDLNLPTAFRPFSGIAENQRFRPYGGPVFNYSIKIFNRWGQQVFEEDIPEARDQGWKGQGWDGRFKGALGSSGVYIYVVIFDVEHEDRLIQTTKHGWFMLL
jgi:hypothetical protein